MMNCTPALRNSPSFSPSELIAAPVRRPSTTAERVASIAMTTLMTSRASVLRCWLGSIFPNSMPNNAEPKMSPKMTRANQDIVHAARLAPAFPWLGSRADREIRPVFTFYPVSFDLRYGRKPRATLRRGDETFEQVRFSADDGFDAPVGAIAHPACEAKRPCLACEPLPAANTLHPARDQQMEKICSLRPALNGPAPMLYHERLPNC